MDDSVVSIQRRADGRRRLGRLVRPAAFIGLAVWLAGCTGTHQIDFASPDEATEALVTALNPRDVERLKEIFGSGTEEVMDSGDAVADARNRERFLAKYAERHELVSEADGAVVLHIGDDGWPFAFPLVPDGDRWRFDTEAGEIEILDRRIGANELDAIETCLAYVDAQLEYAMRDPDGDGIREFAPQVVSDPGQRNGLYWPAGPNEPLSPLGMLAAAASEAGYTAREPGESPRPLFGYFFEMLSGQGPHAPGGERSYMVAGRMIGGFGLIARPATYGNSGIMTFIVNQDGVVYEKDLGPGTERIARAMTVFDPDASWEAVNPAPFESMHETGER